MRTYHNAGYSGKYKIQFPPKYALANTSFVRYKSLLERRFMMFCDMNPKIMQWGYETTTIPYLSPVDKTIHTYFVDFTLITREKDGLVSKQLVEIKPQRETIAPKIQEKRTRKYVNSVMTYGINTAKWEAARRYCERNNMKFHIITDKTLSTF